MKETKNIQGILHQLNHLMGPPLLEMQHIETPIILYFNCLARVICNIKRRNLKSFVRSELSCTSLTDLELSELGVESSAVSNKK